MKSIARMGLLLAIGATLTVALAGPATAAAQSGELLGSLVSQVVNLLKAILSAGALNRVLPSGVLGG
ncbi:hypothetical protein ACFKCF_08710 [Nonomuraea sp. JJY05]